MKRFVLPLLLAILAPVAAAEDKQKTLEELKAELQKGKPNPKPNSEARAYGVAVRAKVQKNFSLPEKFKDKTLKTVVEVTPEKDGTLKDANVSESSGDTEFDALVLAAVIASSPFPPPPGILLGKPMALAFTAK